MTTEEYNIQLKILYDEYQVKRNLLLREFVDENNPHKIGDIVTDHIGSIKVEKTGYYSGLGSDSYPSATYWGLELKKDGTPKKNGSKRTVYQPNLITK